MKYIEITPNETLASLTEKVGVANVDQILADNGLTRAPNIGKQWAEKVSHVQADADEVNSQRKLTILNKFVDNSDIYETAALSDESTWKVLSSLNSFPNYLYISDSIDSSVPDSYNVLGNKISISSAVFNYVTNALGPNGTGEIDGSIFSQYSTIRDTGYSGVVNSNGMNVYANSNPMNWFNIPNNSVVLYSSISGTSLSIPAYPEEISDSRSAEYTTMPDLLYQYEPWQMYQSSGPRQNTYNFKLHRDMWTGDHSDGKANELIRFCEAQCYPRYSGSAVQVPTVTLYVSGSNLITGTMNNVDVKWYGPLGCHDNWYLAFDLSFTITEVSPNALNYDSVMAKSLIG